MHKNKKEELRILYIHRKKKHNVLHRQARQQSCFYSKSEDTYLWNMVCALEAAEDKFTENNGNPDL